MNLYLFFKTPNYKKGETGIRKYIRFSFFTILIYFLFTFLVSGIIIYFNIDLVQKEAVKKVFSNDSFIFKAIIFAPFIEEFFFRAILKPKKISLVLFVFSFIYYLLTFLGLEMLLSLFISLIFGVLVYFIKIKFNKDLYTKNYKLIIYFSSIVFGLFHIINYEVTYLILILFPILMFPKIYLGFSLAFIRIKFGLIYSILLHSFINSIPFIIEYLSK